MAGATFALPSTGRFSASGFLPDVRAAGATYFNYVGKPLSYILATPEQPDDADNPLVRASATRAQPTTSPASPSASARRDRRVRLHRGRRHGAAHARHAPGALGRAPEGTVVLDPATGRSARRRVSTSGAGC